MCEQQSPIDLANPIYVNDYEKAGLGEPLDIHWGDTFLAEISTDEMKVKFSCNKDVGVSLEGSSYELVEFHFHFPSEHWEKGVQQQVEAHIVHQNAQTGDRVVLGVFIESKTNIRGKVTSLLNTKAYLALDDDPVTSGISTDPNDWIPRNTKKYYRYEGSLTTPEYDENVHWIVFPDRLKIDHETFMKVIKCFGKPARVPQPLCRRFLLANFKP